MTATFRCLISGQTVTFVHQVDIDSMFGHPDYEQVEDTPEVLEAPTKKAGRPKKVDTTASEEE